MDLLTKRYKKGDVDKGGYSILTEAKGGITSQEGSWHAMKNLETVDANRVEKIDAKFEKEGAICVNCKFDVELEPSAQQPLKYKEYKAYQEPSLIPVNQFKEYLNNISDLTQLNYVFSKQKLDPGNIGGDYALSQAKKGMAKVINKNAKDLWETKSSLFNGKKVIVEGNEITITKWEDLRDVASKAEFLNSNLLDFIKAN